jgi:hypothetical protein
VARLVEKRNAYRILLGNPEQRFLQEDFDVGGRIILKRILKKQDDVV